jgi:hypothetical protein
MTVQHREEPCRSALDRVHFLEHLARDWPEELEPEQLSLAV